MIPPDSTDCLVNRFITNIGKVVELMSIPRDSDEIIDLE